MGANGYLVRRSAFDVVPLGDYFFDIDFVHDLVRAGKRVVARVDVPIRHYFCDCLASSTPRRAAGSTTSTTTTPRAGARIRGRRGSCARSPTSCSRPSSSFRSSGRPPPGTASPTRRGGSTCRRAGSRWRSTSRARSVGDSSRSSSTARGGASDVPGLRLGGEPRRVPGAGLVSAGQLRDVPLPRVRAVWLALPGPAPVAAGARDGALWLPRRRRRAGLDRAARRTARRAARPPRSSRPPTTRGRSSRSDAATASSSTGSVRAAGAASCVASSRTQAPHGRPPSGSACPSRRARRSRSRRPRAASGRS